MRKPSKIHVTRPAAGRHEMTLRFISAGTALIGALTLFCACGREPATGGVYNAQAGNNGSAALDDGSTGAIAGRPNFPNFFEDSREVMKPVWKVAGIGYRVGISPETNLKNPAVDGLPAGAVYDGAARVVRVTANDVVIDGYDFSLGLIGISIDAVTGVRIRNCKFSGGTPVRAAAGAGQIYFGYNDVDGGGASGDTAAEALLILENRPGDETVVEYNRIRNVPRYALSVNGGGHLLYRNNLLEDVGFVAGQTGSFLRFGGGDFTHPKIAFNTIIQRPGRSELAELLQIFSTSTGSLRDAEVDHNTIFALGDGTSCSVIFHGGADSEYPWSVTGWAHDNDIDASGASRPAMPGLSGFVYLQNTDLTRNTPIAMP